MSIPRSFAFALKSIFKRGRPKSADIKFCLMCDDANPISHFSPYCPSCCVEREVANETRRAKHTA